MLADTRSEIIFILLNTWGTLVALSPWVLGGIILGAFIATFVPKERSFSFLRGRRSIAVLPLASIIGMVSPACTYGTVPIFVEAIKRGASVGPAAAFLVASSLVNPQMSVLAAGALGVKMAILQTVVALAAAVIVGVAAEIAVRNGISIQNKNLLASPDDHNSAKHKKHHHHHDKHGNMSKLHVFINEFINLFEFVGFYILIGTLAASALPFIINMSKIMGLLGSGNWYAVPLGALAAVPTYVCGGGMIPVLAQGAKSGMHQGAILAFLIAGPATRITPLAALSVIIKKRYVAAYVGFVIILSMIVGLLMAPWL